MIAAALLVAALHWAPFPVGEPVSHGWHLVVYGATPEEARAGCITRMAQDVRPGELVDCTAAPQWMAPYPDTTVEWWSS